MDTEQTRNAVFPFIVYFVIGNVLAGVMLLSLGVFNVELRGFGELLQAAVGVVIMPLAAGLLVYMVTRWVAPRQNGEFASIVTSGIILLLVAWGGVATK